MPTAAKHWSGATSWEQGVLVIYSQYKARQLVWNTQKDGLSSDATEHLAEEIAKVSSQLYA